jgi:hypothetical protein
MDPAQVICSRVRMLLRHAPLRFGPRFHNSVRNTASCFRANGRKSTEYTPTVFGQSVEAPVSGSG